MVAPAFLIAKYTPDIRRSEPRNMGVIVWASGNVSARFAGESQAERAGISPPQHLRVNSNDAYRKWVRYWRELITRPAIRGLDGSMVARESPAFVDALESTSKPQYRLVRGGEFVKALKSSELPDVTDDLYDELVAVSAAADEAADSSARLRRAADKVFKIIGLRLGADYERSREVGGVIADRWQGFTYDYVIGPGYLVGKDSRPDALAQRVLLSNEKSVARCALSFQWAQQGALHLSAAHRIAMIDSSLDRHDTKESQFGLSLIRNHCDVVDMASADADMKMMRLSHKVVEDGPHEGYQD